ncbi:diguanylate cyclase (GGDEF) domain-containing protein [Alteromonadaceae bacterium Bs31]|nr:diguanylate cyclase (GGDEF) domain-containing protein [Alteromonadaceae bacterium Bs31]
MVTLASSKQGNAGKQVSNASWAERSNLRDAELPGANATSPKDGLYNAVNGFPAENALRDLQFKLANNLQCSLDLQTTLELFFDNIQDAVAVNGLSYQLPGGTTLIKIGNQRAHSANYNMSSGELSLGNIVVSRAKRFLEPELATLESLLGVLFFPLRNALMYQQALENSLRDTLTGIGNRSALDAGFAREIKLAQRHKQALSLLVLDIDYFKKINDRHGHRHGDKVLQHVAKTVQHSLRETDQVFRYGGEEFVALLNNTSLADAQLTAERIRMSVAMTPIELNDEKIFVSISIGVSDLRSDDTSESLFERADKALFKAKQAGRNKVMLSDA